ncbi:hypothetical protein ADK61_31915 [Streptomyces sp. XY66]|nr:hypothetical protein ADK61_31915 [Streptomyces sp. XY66]
MHAFLTGRGLLEAGLGQHRPHAQHKLVLVIFHAREVEARQTAEALRHRVSCGSAGWGAAAQEVVERAADA